MSAQLGTARLTMPSSAGGRSLLRLLAAAGLFLVLVIAVLGIRTMTPSPTTSHAISATAARAAFPTSAAIEDKWGIRFTAVNVLADGGMVEVRYLVLDPAKGGRIHSGDIKDLPILRADDSGKEVRSWSLMFHLHANHIPTEVDGRSYSLVFGNADAALHTGGTVTVILADGLRLEHLPVG